MRMMVGTIASSNSSPIHFAVRVWQGSTRNKNTDPLYGFLERRNHVTACAP
jgi:hypothetical protein